MRRRFIVIGVALLCVTTACGGGGKKKVAANTPPTTVGPLTPAQVFDRTRGATVELLGKQGNNDVGGSGVVIDPAKGYVLTAAHVVAGTSALKVRVGDGPNLLPARILGTAPCEDVAVVQIVGAPPDLQSVPFAASSTLRNEDEVVALGYPETLSATDKLVSTDGRVQAPNVALTDVTNYPKLPATIQHSATINPGNSGGPLLNDRAQLVGINVGDNPNATNQNYAIASDHINQLLADLEAGKSSAYVGWDVEPVALSRLESVYADNDIATPQEIRAAVATLQSESLTRALVVYGVDSGSPADTAHIFPADVITSINGTNVSSQGDVCDILQSARPGQKLQVRGVYATDDTGGAYSAGDTWNTPLVIK